MFRSIFTKYITTFMLIIVVSFTMLAAIISTLMVDYYGETKGELVNSTAYSLKYLIEERYNDIEDESFKDYVRSNTEEVRTYFMAFTEYAGELSIFVTDTDGHILASTGFKAGVLGGDTIPQDILKDAKNKEYKAEGDLGGLLKTSQTIKGMAINKNGAPVGTVFVCSTFESINILMRTMIKTIIMTCLWVLLAALIAVYFISEKIISPLKDMSRAAKSFASGKFDVRVTVTGHDEISELAVAFNNMAGSLADLENMRSTFMSNVSHDLRTPMTTISGFIDALLDGTIPQDKHEYYLRMIGDEVRRLSRLVAALLDVSRIQAGDRKFTMTAFDICEMARVILISFEQRIDKKNLEVDFDCDAENLYVFADRDAIYQILYNICDNGVKFSRDGGKYRIKILERDRRVYVSVYNEGDGIKSEDLAHVFERFYKGDKSRGLDKSGVGLGLYIAKSIMDAHNEEIWVKSTYGEYCEFVFTMKKATENQVKKSFDRNLSDDQKKIEK